MMLGYPGAGKSTTAKRIKKLSGAKHLSSDAVRLELFPTPTYSQEEHDTVYRALDARAEAFLSQGKDVIYDANFNHYVHRAEKYRMCKRVGARPVLLWLQLPLELARDRAELRGHYHLVPIDETFESMFDRVTAAIEKPHKGEPVLKLDSATLTEDDLAKALEELCQDAKNGS